MEAEKTWEKKKTVIKIGGDGGSGIGAVVVLGGALATAAFAAAFAVRTKGRSSGNDQNSIPKQSEHDETSKHPSSAATAEVESNNDNDDTAVVDDKPMIEEINGGFVETSKPILCPISPKKLEKDAIVDGSVIVEGFPLSDEKLPFEQMMNGTKEDIDDGEKEGLIGKETIETSDIKPKQEEEEEEDSEVRYDQEAETEATIEEDNSVVGVHLIEALKNLNTKVETEKQESDGFCSDDDGEISEEKEVIESRNQIGLKLSESESESSLVSESHSEVGLKVLLPVFENPFVQHENVNGDERESSLIVVEIIKESDEAAIEGSQEEQVSYIEEQIVPENREEVESQRSLLNDLIRVTQDKNALSVHLKPAENRELELPMLKEEPIFPVDEAVKDDGASEEVAERLKVNENEIENENENEISVQVIHGQPKDGEDDDANRNITEDIKEELILAEDDQVTQGYGANEKPKYDDDPEINIEWTNEANQGRLLNDSIDMKEDENALLIHPTPHKNREFELPMPKEEPIFPEDGEHEEVAESMVPKEKREDDDPDQINTGKEVVEGVTSPANEESVELNEEHVFVSGDRSKDDEEEEDDDDDAEIKGDNELTETDEEFTESMELNQNEAEDHEEEEDDDAEIINVESDDLITETSEDEESSEDDAGIEHFHGDEKAISEDGEEVSEGSGGDSSMESNSEVIDPADEPKREVEGKIEEDRAVKKTDLQKMSGSTEKSNSKKRVMEAKDNYRRRRMLIGTVSLLSSLSCSWYLGLSSVELCFIVFLTMVISSLATSRQVRGFEHRS